MKSLTIRLIGSQAIALAQYGYRLVDSLQFENESEAEIVTRLAMSKISEALRDIGPMINKVNVTSECAEKVDKLCKLYFNLYSIFSPQKCQVTVWTLGYVVPFHCKLLYTEYRVGYGILTMQGKESKHSAIKQELK